MVLIANQKIVDICHKVINEEIGIIEGCRELVSLRGQYNLEEDELFDPIVGVDSETDDYPLGDVRELFSKDYLDRLDREVGGYILKVRLSVIEDCRNLIEKYS